MDIGRNLKAPGTRLIKDSECLKIWSEMHGRLICTFEQIFSDPCISRVAQDMYI